MSFPVVFSPSGVRSGLTPPVGTPELLDSETLVHKTMLMLTSQRAVPLESLDCEDSFFIADLGVVYRQFKLWVANLPKVRPYYAVKCNGDKKVLQMLAGLGAGFDCASQKEISTILDLAVPADRIVYANTVKHPSYLQYASMHDVRRMTFDNADELYKVQANCPNAELLLRIVTDDSAAACSLSCKFGASLSDTDALLKTARGLGLKVVGVAFHVGSGGAAVDNYTTAMRDARHVFTQGRNLGHDMTVLDIGGGFEPATFVAAASTIRAALDELDFGPKTELMAEPGRFMVSEAYTLVTSVIGRRLLSPNKAMLYVSDGCYGNLNCVIYDHHSPAPHLLEANASVRRPGDVPMEASVWGPTCDGIDRIASTATFPKEVTIGDWIYFKNVGAYTLAASTQFNGFNSATSVHYVCSEEASMPDKTQLALSGQN